MQRSPHAGAASFSLLERMPAIGRELKQAGGLERLSDFMEAVCHPTKASRTLGCQITSHAVDVREHCSVKGSPEGPAEGYGFPVYFAAVGANLFRLLPRTATRATPRKA